jgi:hypothetical protein
MWTPAPKADFPKASRSGAPRPPGKHRPRPGVTPTWTPAPEPILLRFPVPEHHSHQEGTARVPEAPVPGRQRRRPIFPQGFPLRSATATRKAPPALRKRPHLDASAEPTFPRLPAPERHGHQEGTARTPEALALRKRPHLDANARADLPQGFPIRSTTTPERHRLRSGVAAPGRPRRRPIFPPKLSAPEHPATRPALPTAGRQPES